MKNFIFILLLIICNIFYSSTSAYANDQKSKNEVHFSEKDINVDNAVINLRTFKKNFKEKYTDSEFVYEYKTAENNAWDRFKEWLASILRNLFSNLDPEKSTKVVGYIIYGIAILIIIVVVYLIVKSIINKEGSWIFRKNSSKKIDNYSDLEKNLQLVDFETLIKKTLPTNQNRLCIRYYYLWLLQRMSAKDIIIWDLEKTNSDYLYEIKNEKQKATFDYLSYLYNNIWYGEFEVDQETFAKAKNTFEKAIQNLDNV